MSAHSLKFKNTSELLKYIEENDIQFIDMNFTDLHGKWQHTTQHVKAFDKNAIENGSFFNGAGIKGWKDVHESDMLLVPDISKICIDPFSAQRTIKVICDIVDPMTKKSYERDPRYTAKKAEEYLKKSGIADAAYFGTALEFFVFEDVRIHTFPNHVSFQVDSEECPHNAGRTYPDGNLGHRPKTKGGYLPESPIDALSDIRGEMITVMHSMGLNVEKHHHETAPAQCEIGVAHSSLTDSADNVQIYKHAVHNVARSYGKTATFMPKPLFGDNGSGMHSNQSLWKSGKPLFAGNNYADLSEAALFYIGGIIKHAKALNAFTNPSTNSYKRLIPGYDAPTLLSYSARNRSAACRIPHVTAPSAKRVEMRFPDATSNPYLAFSALLMAGLDGIEKKIHPGDAIDKNIYDLDKNDTSTPEPMCRSLREAIKFLRADMDFLLKGDVFTKDMVETYIALKEEEMEVFQTMVHPAEYYLYYSC